MQVYYVVRVFHIAVGELRDVHQAVLVNADIDEGAEVGDVGHDSGQHHALHQVVDACHIGVELKLLYLFARVAAGLLQLAHDVGEGGQPHRRRHIAADVNLVAFLAVGHQFGHAAAAVAGHLRHYGVALRVYGTVVQGI